MSGGLDVLETIGKKTFDVIKEHDPVLRKTREMFLFEKGDKPNLSHVLREAKKDSDARVEMEHQMEEARKVNFGAVFDEFQGRVITMISSPPCGHICNNVCKINN